MVGFFCARGLEGRYSASLRVDTAEDVFDGAVFPSRIHGLQHDQQSSLVLRVETLLEVLYAPALFLQRFGDVLFLLVMLGLVGIYPSLEMPLARLDSVAWVIGLVVDLPPRPAPVPLSE